MPKLNTKFVLGAIGSNCLVLVLLECSGLGVLLLVTLALTTRGTDTMGSGLISRILLELSVLDCFGLFPALLILRGISCDVERDLEESELLKLISSSACFCFFTKASIFFFLQLVTYFVFFLKFSFLFFFSILVLHLVEFFSIFFVLYRKQDFLELIFVFLGL